MMGLIFLGMQALGWLKFESFAWNTDPAATVTTQAILFFFVFVLVGFNEELLFRGYHLQTITSGLNLFWGLIISSIIFGGLHLANPNATWVSAAGIFFAGLFLAYGYIRTKQLWLSIGLHIGWNFFEGVAFGFPVSGLSIYPHTLEPAGKAPRAPGALRRRRVSPVSPRDRPPARSGLESGSHSRGTADRRVEITGPVERKMVINALNSGANVFMADFEDSNSPTWQNMHRGPAQSAGRRARARSNTPARKASNTG